MKPTLKKVKGAAFYLFFMLYNIAKKSLCNFVKKLVEKFVA